MQISRITSFTPVFFGNTNIEKAKKPETKKPELTLISTNEKKIAKSSDPLSETGKLNAQVKKMLDDSTFLFDTDNGVKVMTIKDFVQSNIYREREVDETGVYNFTASKETAREINQNGFDYSKILKTEDTPGVYLKKPEKETSNLNDISLKANIKGNVADLDPKWYSRIYNSCASDRITQFTGNQRSRADKALGEYVRNLMVEDLGIDIGYMGNKMICFNPNSISNVEKV